MLNLALLFLLGAIRGCGLWLHQCRPRGRGNRKAPIVSFSCCYL